jgi:peptidoglycan/xylan/chitin deacetylase (PgdA/CDA1 family)
VFRRASAWEGEPPEVNPVARIIGVRTAQAGGAAVAALAGLRLALPDALFWPAFFGGGALVGGGLSAYFVATFTAGLPFPGAPLLVRLPESAGPDAVALTFDDGPHPETTPRLLDTLAAHGAQATFFLVGERASRYAKLARRVTEAGHMVGVHGLRHRTMALDTAGAIRRDLAEAARRIEDATGAAPLAGRWLRPPYGFKSLTLCRTATEEGWRLAAWSLDARDYDPQTPETLAARILGRLAPGDVVLLHERPGVPATLDALPRLLAGCAERGLRLVALPPVALPLAGPTGGGAARSHPYAAPPPRT